MIPAPRAADLTSDAADLLRQACELQTVADVLSDAAQVNYQRAEECRLHAATLIAGAR